MEKNIDEIIKALTELTIKIKEEKEKRTREETRMGIALTEWDSFTKIGAAYKREKAKNKGPKGAQGPIWAMTEKKQGDQYTQEIKIVYETEGAEGPDPQRTEEPGPSRRQAK